MILYLAIFRTGRNQNWDDESLYPLWCATLWRDLYLKLVLVASGRQPDGSLCADVSITFLFDTFYTAIATSLYVLPYTMAESNQARDGIFVWKIFFTLLSLAAPLVLFPLVRPDVGESASRFQTIMIMLGVVTTLVIFFSTFFIKKNIRLMLRKHRDSGSLSVSALKTGHFWCMKSLVLRLFLCRPF